MDVSWLKIQPLGKKMRSDVSVYLLLISLFLSAGCGDPVERI
jgi:hypothetical protein